MSLGVPRCICMANHTKVTARCGGIRPTGRARGRRSLRMTRQKGEPEVRGRCPLTSHQDLRAFGSTPTIRSSCSDPNRSCNGTRWLAEVARVPDGWPRVGVCAGIRQPPIRAPAGASVSTVVGESTLAGRVSIAEELTLAGRLAVAAGLPLSIARSWWSLLRRTGTNAPRRGYITNANLNIVRSWLPIEVGTARQNSKGLHRRAAQYLATSLFIGLGCSPLSSPTRETFPQPRRCRLD
jgi:hypothetical protein